MPTIQQLVRKGRVVLKDKSKSPALDEFVRSVVAFVCVSTQLLQKSLTRQCVKLRV